jgi:pyrimidine operon attenuation protein / uracil phosphoribosyltransferase
MEFVEKFQLMDKVAINRALSRMASEIIERNRGTDKLLLIGIRRRGVPLADRIADRIAELEGTRPPVGTLDITLYRDDLSTVDVKPVVQGTQLPENVEDQTIILIDDVLYTGRTIRAALDEIMDFGRPRRVQLAVLVDRGHRELPIHADYVGERISTKQSEIVKVMLEGFDDTEKVIVVESPK